MKAAIVGSTGFIGKLLLNLLKDDSDFESVSVLARRKIQLDDKFNLLIGDIKEQELPASDIAFCALGTTMATAGSKEAFYHVDHDLVVDFATKAKKVGVQTFVLVSSVGADSKSSTYYLKVKGETENDLKEIGFNSLLILRPSMLLGDRTEFRFGELIGKAAMTVFNPLMLGGLTKYKGIEGKTVARCMQQLAKQELPGAHVLEGEQLFAFEKN
ncbi:MAG: hypothetical protein ACI9UR_000540 [Bacteroidia bacterium]|jgi:uncharacterized protein YbjT (DUF2867 family)